MRNPIHLLYLSPLLLLLLLTQSSARIIGNRRTTTETPTFNEIPYLVCAADCAQALEIADKLDPCWEYTDQDAVIRGEVDCLAECQVARCAGVGGACFDPVTCGVPPEATGWDEAEEAVTDGGDEDEEEDDGEDDDAAYIVYDDDWTDDYVIDDDDEAETVVTDGEDEGESDAVMNIVNDDFYDDEYW